MTSRRKLRRSWLPIEELRQRFLDQVTLYFWEHWDELFEGWNIQYTQLAWYDGDFRVSRPWKIAYISQLDVCRDLRLILRNLPGKRCDKRAICNALQEKSVRMERPNAHEVASIMARLEACNCP